MADPAARVITLTGPGGVGKTRLAIEVARAIATEGPTHVAFVALAAIRDPGLAASAIGEALGLRDVSASDLPRRARAACQDRRTLLLLDNFEQVLDAAPVVADLLTSTPTLQLLVTSRAPLRVRGEREYAVEPLALDSDLVSHASATKSPAVQLFAERVRDVQPAFRVTVGNGSTLAAICRRLDALPLALELAAPWTKALRLEDLLRRLEQDVLLSAGAPRDLPERQRTMNATVAWSYQLLTRKEQHVFRRLGVLPDRFPLEAAAAVAAESSGLASRDDVLETVASLIDKSLLLRAETSTPTRVLYRMLETVRAYAALELAAAGERDDAMEGLARYCIAEASRAAEGLVGRAQVEWFDRTREDLESYRSGLRWFIERGRLTEAAGIAWALMLFWLVRGHGIEGLEWYERILSHPSLPRAAELRGLAGAAVMQYSHGNLEGARTTLTRALTLSDDTHDSDLIAYAVHFFGYVEYASGNLDAARDRFARSVELHRTLKNSWVTGSALIGMAWVSLATADTHEAERLLDQAAAVLDRAGPWFLLLPRYLRAIMALRRGNADEAIAWVHESLTQIRELQDRFALVYAAVPLAIAAVLKNDYVWAARILGAREAISERTGSTPVDPFIRDLWEQTERDARARLGSDRWAHAYAEGRQATIDSLLEDIDAHSKRSGHR